MHWSTFSKSSKSRDSFSVIKLRMDAISCLKTSRLRMALIYRVVFKRKETIWIRYIFLHISMNHICIWIVQIKKHKTYRKFFFNLVQFTDYHTDRLGWLCWKTIDHLFKLGLHQQIWNEHGIFIIEICTVLKTDGVIYFSMHNQPYALKKYYIYINLMSFEF